jgi:hypothetical protein
MTQVEPDQVQYLIYGEPRQNASVVDELRSVRRQQIVSQRSLVLNDTDQQAAPRELPEEMPADGPADRKAETQSAEGSARVEGYVAVEDAPGGALRLRQASSERSTSRGNGGGDDGASLAGANVEPLLVTLNFRPAARPAPRRPVPGRTPATQADSGE